MSKKKQRSWAIVLVLAGIVLALGAMLIFSNSDVDHSQTYQIDGVTCGGKVTGFNLGWPLVFQNHSTILSFIPVQPPCVGREIDQWNWLNCVIDLGICTLLGGLTGLGLSYLFFRLTYRQKLI